MSSDESLPIQSELQYLVTTEHQSEARISEEESRVESLPLRSEHEPLRVQVSSSGGTRKPSVMGLAIFCMEKDIYVCDGIFVNQCR